jgi:hypothetical protein
MKTTPPSTSGRGDRHGSPARRARLLDLPAIRRPGRLAASLVLAGFVAMSVHVGLLAAGVPFPLPRPPIWAQWLNESFVAGALLAVLQLARHGAGHRGILARTAIAFLVMAAIQETLRIGLMSGIVTGAWAYSAIGLIRPVIRVIIVAALCAAGARLVRGLPSLLVAALVIGATSTAARKLTAHALDPLVQHFAWLARPDIYAFPYPFHVTIAAYLSFAEAVAGALLTTMLVWDGLPASTPVRLLAIALLVALIKGVVGSTLLYGAFTGGSLLLGIGSWSQFLLEFLTLGALVGLSWELFGHDSTPTRASCP